MKNINKEKEYIDLKYDHVPSIEEIQRDIEEYSEEKNHSCNDCETCRENEKALDELIDNYVEQIQETNGCPNCIKGILMDLISEFIENDEED